MLSGPTSLQRRGLTSYINATLGVSVTIVTAAANVNGVIIRTVAANTAANLLVVRASGSTLLFLGDSARTYFGPGIVVPPGQEITAGASGGTVDTVITYDILP